LDKIKREFMARLVRQQLHLYRLAQQYLLIDRLQ
jgi:hypothetical protein